MKLPEIKINFVTVWKLIQKYLLTKKREIMCFKLFSKPDPPVNPDNQIKRAALFFAINDYPGSQNDLNGCLNDQSDWVKVLDSLFPGFIIKRFKDKDATRKNFINEVTNAIQSLTAKDLLFIHYSGHGTQVYDIHGDDEDGYDEALYLYDGTVIDDDIGIALKGIPDGAVVLLMFDSCFSGTITRVINGSKPKFVPHPEYPVRKKKRIRIPKEEMKWIVFSGCGEHQTSADAFIDGKYHGAFTYFSIKTLLPGITYQEWFNKLRKELPNKYYEQAPTLEGDRNLFSKKVFT